MDQEQVTFRALCRCHHFLSFLHADASSCDSSPLASQMSDLVRSGILSNQVMLQLQSVLLRSK